MSHIIVRPFLLCLVMICLAGVHVEAQVDQPNIVLIIADDAGYADFGFQDDVHNEPVTDIPTPAIDALARQGVIFRQGYTQVACSPSRAAFLTGAYTERWGYEANIQAVRNQLTQHYAGLPSEAVTIFERLQDLNYTTGTVGKWHSGGMDDLIVNGQIVSPGNRPPRQGVDEFVGFQAPDGLQRQSLNADNTVNVSNINSGGRHLSDFWGDESIDFIDRHHQASNPFFLYVSFNEPHAPVSDSPYLNDSRIANLSGSRKQYAAEVISIDRNIERIIAKMEDPNGDGNTNDSLMDNTLIVFMNDNGGPSNTPSDNLPLRGAKGSPYEGAIRVPFFVTGAGVDASVRGTVYDEIVASVDISGTIFAAAGGGDLRNEDLYYGNGAYKYDGVDLLPFVNGTTTETRPHDSFTIRLQEETSLVTTDWKLVKDGYDNDWELYEFSNTGSQSEAASANVAAQNPLIVAQLQRQLTDYEVVIDKQQFPSTDESIGEFNLFNDFTFRTDAFTNAAWSTNNAWDSPSGTPETMRDRDSFNGTTVHFGTQNNSSYTVVNDLLRMNELDFIAHGFTFEGDFSGTENQSADLDGLPVLLATNFDEEAPEIALDATGSGPSTFAFNLHQNVESYDNLLVTGDGNQEFNLNGDITEYRTGLQLIKSGTSTADFRGDITFTGGMIVQQGKAILHSNASLTGDLNVEAGGIAEVMASITGNVDNAGRIIIPAPAPTTGSSTVDLTPTLGDGEVDQRLATTAAEQDAEILVGHVFNANANEAARVIRGIFSYDLSAIPDDATIDSVSFQLTHASPDGASNDQIAGDLELRELLQDPVFRETGAANVNWLNRDNANSNAWSTPGGPVGNLLAQIVNGNLPAPTSVVSGQKTDLNSLAAFLTAIENNLDDDTLSLSLLLPGEEAAGNAGNGNRDLFRFSSNEAGQPAVLSINYTHSGPTNPPLVTGDFTQLESATLEIDLGGIQTGDNVHLQVSGNVSLGGTLDVSMSDGFNGSPGQTFDIIMANEVTGTFDNVIAPEGINLQVNYSNSVVSLSVIDDVLLGDVNMDGTVNFLDISSFISLLSSGMFKDEADIDRNGVVNFLDISPFISILSGA